MHFSVTINKIGGISTGMNYLAQACRTYWVLQDLMSTKELALISGFSRILSHKYIV